MADNSVLPATGDVIAADDIGGVKFQRMKLAHGVDGVNDGDVAKTNPLPVAQIAAVTATVSQTAQTITPATLLAANANRKSAILWNTGAATLYVLFGVGTVSSTNWSAKLNTDDRLVLSPGDFSGVISGVWSATGSGYCTVTETS